MVVLAILATALRIWARVLTKVNLWWDDWLCIPFAILPSIFDFVQIKNGFGRPMSTVFADKLVTYSLFLYILMLFYNLGLAFFKLSCLALYIRIFGVHRWIRHMSYIIGGMVIAWVLANELALVFRCHPIDLAWKGNAEQQATSCITQTNIFIAQSAPTIFFDLLILIMPIRVVWSLQLQSTQKLGAILVFSLGLLVTVISMVRLAGTLHSTDTDLTYGYVELGMWSAVEPVTGLICCSVMTYGSFIKKLRQLGKGYIHGKSNLYRQSHSSNSYATHNKLTSPRSAEYARSDLELTVCSFSNETPVVKTDPLGKMPDRAINITHEFHVRRD
ncbi:uncharacterized protein BO80DRAFT_422975 [Aspergillus ibericus CBS 121593]|uniref:Rhodopsin domain-containing protein n=1 Tax=Aspergillus ibericus CBS 121593 TaxID=1448316 RepID=A0A395H6K4_9EURO|nr:hypothetical protein BO80DRAFT_422975 [Aspergillus ibericus CBS 121593]RAL03537.1 hypothetical protein BO80DRAFT_422975 [Aspergillus ibericus CBS 121593]